MKHTQNKKGFVAPCHVRCRVPAARCAGKKRLLRSLLWLLPPAKVHVLLNIPFFCPLLPPAIKFHVFLVRVGFVSIRLHRKCGPGKPEICSAVGFVQRKADGSSASCPRL